MKLCVLFPFGHSLPVAVVVIVEVGAEKIGKVGRSLKVYKYTREISSCSCKFGWFPIQCSFYAISINSTCLVRHLQIELE